MNVAAMPEYLSYSIDEIRYMHYLWLEGKKYIANQGGDAPVDTTPSSNNEDCFSLAPTYNQCYSSDTSDVAPEAKETEKEFVEDVKASKSDPNYIESSYFHQEMSMLWGTGHGFQTGTGRSPSTYVQYQNCKVTPTDQQSKRIFLPTF